VGYNFISCDRDQQFLMPPSLDDWLPKNLCVPGTRSRSCHPFVFMDKPAEDGAS
jgi:hypothetical protein